MENKVYKLIQIYPGSPEEDTIVIEDEKGYYNEALNVRFPKKSFVENYPKSWELQEYSNFIIRSIVSPDGYVRTGKNVMYEHAYGMYSKYKIHTIKRLSDGEEFKIGDIITSPLNQNMTISNFKLKEKDLIIFYNGDIGDIGAVCFIKGCIDTINKVKTKLFTTEDGVDVFEGGSFQRVSRRDFTLFHENTIPVTRKYLYETMNKNYFHFSTKEKAEEYIKMNKKEFSRAQIIKLLDAFHFGEQMKYHFINLLTEEKIIQ